MRKPPPIGDFRRYPATAALGALTIAISVLCFAKPELLQQFTIDVRLAHGEAWRAFSSVFPHGDFLHLAFNIAWLWALGSLIESILGARTMLTLTALFALVSTTADYAFSQGGIGLSGIVYGYFAFIWVRSRRDERFRDAIDKQTIYLFVGWFFFCIVATRLRWMNIGNVAHGAGAVAGAAAALLRRGNLVLGALTAVLLVAGFRFRVRVNSNAGSDAAYLGYVAIKRSDKANARRWFAEAAVLNPTVADYWYNLAILEAETGDAHALEHFQRAVSLAPNDPRFSDGLQWAEQR